MKKHKVAQKLILLSFVVVICLSWAFGFIFRQFLDTTNHENRKMAEIPTFRLSEYEKYPEEFTNWLNDNMPFRNALISLNSYIDYSLFKYSTNPTVKIGKGDWLFYSNVGDGDSIGTVQGKNLLSEEELKKIADNCMKQRDFIESQGKEFVIFIGPNKEGIYSEYLPDYYGKPAEFFKTKQIVDYLKENTDLRVVFPYDELKEAKKQIKENLYYTTDTHWNYLGGYIGASALLKELGIDMPAITDLTISKDGNYAGDLAAMLNLSNQLLSKDFEYSLSGYDKHNVNQKENSFFEVFSYSAENADNRSIYILRDSYTTSMAPYIGSQFRESYMRHGSSYTYDDLKKQDSDIVVYETVERAVDLLGTFSFQ